MNDKKEILLGDNPFFGIDHLSQERARERIEILKGFQKITEVMEFVTTMGVKGFVVSTHPQLRDLVNYMKTNTNLLQKMDFYPILPYAQGYVSKVTEKGMIGAMNDILSGSSLQKKLKIFFNSSVGFMRKDFHKLLQTFIDIELIPLSNVKKKNIFLHDVVTDLAISLGMKNIIVTFLDHVKNSYKVEAGLVTKNFPKLINTLKEWNVGIPIVMTSFNPIGYQMNPSKEECEKYLRETNKVIAMNALAGGFLRPSDAAKYISKLKMSSVVIGMSTKEHAKETITAFKLLGRLNCKKTS